MSSGLSPPGNLPRVVDGEMRAALAASPAVLIEGPRACGKTWTARRFAAGEQLLDATVSARLAANLDATALLDGAWPRLLDEWQLAPDIWNPMRRACDDRALPGQFILTGSADPPDDITRHSGAGRVLRVRMRPMSLFESGESDGSVSLAGLFAPGRRSAADSGHRLGVIVAMACRGGWPNLVRTRAGGETALRMLRGYLDEISRTDVSRVDGVADLKFAGLLFESLVVRDLRIHGQAGGCELSHYRDGDGLEIDAIVRHPDGRWIAAEVRLGGEVAIEQAVHNLNRLRRRIDADRTGPPSRLVVITAGGHGYEHPDGATIVPITSLGP